MITKLYDDMITKFHNCMMICFLLFDYKTLKVFFDKVYETEVTRAIEKSDYSFEFNLDLGRKFITKSLDTYNNTCYNIYVRRVR